MIARLAALVPVAMLLAAGPSDPLAGRIAGEPRQCLDLSMLSGPNVVDAQTILYTQSGRRVWRTGPVGNCPALRPFTTLIVEIGGGQLCRNDRFRVRSPGEIIPSGVCRFDTFVPYDKPPKARTG